MWKALNDNSFKLCGPEAPWFEAVVTSGHVDHRPNWVLRCQFLGLDIEVLRAQDPLEAQAEAIKVIEKRLDELKSLCILE